MAGRRRNLRKTTDDCQARRHAPQCTFYSVRLLHPRDSGEDNDFHVPPLMYTAPPYDYKRRRRASFKGDGHPHSRSSSHSQHHSEHMHSLLAPTSLFATLNPSSNRDLGASLPLSPCLYPLLQSLRVQDNTVPSHTPLLDVRPRGRNQYKSVRSCVASCIKHLELGHVASLLVSARPPGLDTDRMYH